MAGNVYEKDYVQLPRFSHFPMSAAIYLYNQDRKK